MDRTAPSLSSPACSCPERNLSDDRRSGRWSVVPFSSCHLVHDRGDLIRIGFLQCSGVVAKALAPDLHVAHSTSICLVPFAVMPLFLSEKYARRSYMSISPQFSGSSVSRYTRTRPSRSSPSMASPGLPLPHPGNPPRGTAFLRSPRLPWLRPELGAVCFGELPTHLMACQVGFDDPIRRLPVMSRRYPCSPLLVAMITHWRGGFRPPCHTGTVLCRLRWRRTPSLSRYPSSSFRPFPDLGDPHPLQTFRLRL